MRPFFREFAFFLSSPLSLSPSGEVWKFLKLGQARATGPRIVVLPASPRPTRALPAPTDVDSSSLI